MAGFTKWADVVGRYKQLDALAGGASEVSSHYILPAEYELEGRLSGVFTIPFSSTNVTAIDLVVDMVRVRAGVGKEKDIKIVADRIEDRISKLLSGSSSMLVTSSNGNVSPLRANIAGTIWQSDEDYHPTFGHGDGVEFVVDSDRLTDERNARGVFP